MFAVNTRGFTLIEALVYLALFTLVLGGVMVAAYALFDTSERSQARAMLQEEKEFLISKISRVLDTAALVSDPAAGATGATLWAQSYPGLGGTWTEVTSLAGNLHIGGVAMNNSNVTLENSLSFEHVYSGGTAPETITTTFTITTRSSLGVPISQTATFTRAIRK